MKNALIVSIQAIKGGVGKTTISTNLAHVCAMAGYKVLMCDQDPQGSATELFGAYDSDNRYVDKGRIKALGLYDLYLNDVDTNRYIFRTRYENIDIIPNARNIRDDTPFDIVFANERRSDRDKYLALRNNLLKVIHEYDYIFIDGYPTDGRLTDTLVLASDSVITPVLPDVYNLNAVEDITYKINMLDSQFGRDTRFLGYVFNQMQVNNGNKEFQNVYYQKFAETGIDQIKTSIRYSQAVAQKAVAYNMLFVEYNRNSNPAKDIVNLAVNGVGLVDKKHNEILCDNIEKKNFGLRPELVESEEREVE